MNLFEGVTNPQPGDYWPPKGQPLFNGKRWKRNASNTAWDLLIEIGPESFDQHLFIPPGGITGQVLMKLSNDDYDVGWVNI